MQKARRLPSINLARTISGKLPLVAFSAGACEFSDLRYFNLNGCLGNAGFPYSSSTHAPDSYED